MNRHPILDIVATQVLRVLQYLPSKYKAEIFYGSIVKLDRYGFLELKLILLSQNYPTDWNNLISPSSLSRSPQSPQTASLSES